MDAIKYTTEEATRNAINYINEQILPKMVKKNTVFNDFLHGSFKKWQHFVDFRVFFNTEGLAVYCSFDIKLAVPHTRGDFDESLRSKPGCDGFEKYCECPHTKK